MVKIENDCVGPCPQGCMGFGCPNRHVPHFYCDECGDEVSPEELYEYDDEQLCDRCLCGRFNTVV